MKKPKIENKIKKKIQIDQKLNPQTCSFKGYQWTKDTIFTSSAPAIYKEIQKLISQGYCLGQPSVVGASKIYVGLYRPV